MTIETNDSLDGEEGVIISGRPKKIFGYDNDVGSFDNKRPMTRQIPYKSFRENSSKFYEFFPCGVSHKMCISCWPFLF